MARRERWESLCCLSISLLSRVASQTEQGQASCLSSLPSATQLQRPNSAGIFSRVPCFCKVIRRQATEQCPLNDAQPQINDFPEEEMTASRGSCFQGGGARTLTCALFIGPQAAHVIRPLFPIWKKEERGGSLIKAWHRASLAQAVFNIQSLESTLKINSDCLLSCM